MRLARVLATRRQPAPQSPATARKYQPAGRSTHQAREGAHRARSRYYLPASTRPLVRRRLGGLPFPLRVYGIVQLVHREAASACIAQYFGTTPLELAVSRARLLALATPDNRAGESCRTASLARHREDKACSRRHRAPMHGSPKAQLRLVALDTGKRCSVEGIRRWNQAMTPVDAA